MLRLAGSLAGLLLASAGLLMARTGAAEDPTVWTFDPDGSRALFGVRVFGVVPVTGRFRRFTGELVPDEGALVARARISSASLSMSSPTQERWVKSDEFLDVEHHPAIEFESEPFPPERVREGGTVRGTLTIRGRTGDVPVKFKPGRCTWPDPGSCELTATAEIRRNAFKLGAYRAIVGDKVQLSLHLVMRSRED